MPSPYPLYIISFSFSIDNISLPPGDIVFAVQYNLLDGMNTSNQTPKKIGRLVSFSNAKMKVQDEGDLNAPQPGDFIFFAKDPVVTTSSLKGYYADVMFVNDSTEKAELYAVSSEIAESSK